MRYDITARRDIPTPDYEDGRSVDDHATLNATLKGCDDEDGGLVDYYNPDLDIEGPYLLGGICRAAKDDRCQDCQCAEQHPHEPKSIFGTSRLCWSSISKYSACWNLNCEAMMLLGNSSTPVLS